MGCSVRVHVTGRVGARAVRHGASLLHGLRNDLRLNGPKYGCGLGECGACLVLVDGVAARSCVIPAGGVAGREITTLEGLCARAATKASRVGGSLPPVVDDPSQDPQESLHPVQIAFIECQAAQCGYCLNGLSGNNVALI